MDGYNGFVGVRHMLQKLQCFERIDVHGDLSALVQRGWPSANAFDAASPRQCSTKPSTICMRSASFSVSNIKRNIFGISAISDGVLHFFEVVDS